MSTQVRDYLTSWWMAFLAGRPVSFMTCNSARPSSCLLKCIFFYLALSLISFQLVTSIDFKGGNSNNHFTLCDKCKIVVESFKEGLKRTARGKHEGGDAQWEEKKLSNYANSEIRLTEIQESLCTEVSLGKDQCHSFAEEFETDLEEWFFQHLKKEKLGQVEEGYTLFEHLCNHVAKVCCPEGHYGPECLPCLGYPEQVCQGRGICEGNGTREGKGSCKCFKGFAGKNCERCAKTYFRLGTVPGSEVELPKECERCDRSCASCQSAGPKGCLVCGKGYNWDHKSGCIDVNECSQLETNPCAESTYCSNIIGSYNCLQCNKACKVCTGPGDDSCLQCAAEYVLVGSKCQEELQANWIQAVPVYLIYLSLIGISIVILRARFY